MGFHLIPRVDISDADALVTDVKAAKTFYSVAKPKKTGTLPTKAIVAGAETYEEGYHAGNVGGLSAIDADLAPAKIKKDVNIFGKVGTLVEGSDISDANAEVTAVLAPKTFYAGAEPKKTGTMAVKADDTVLNSNDAEKTTFATEYTKVKEIKINEAFAGCRVKFTLRTINWTEGEYSRARVYKNGEAIGAVHTVLNHTIVTFEDDLADFAVDDLIQIYAHSYLGSRAAAVKDMRFCYAGDLAVGLSVTNQDP